MALILLSSRRGSVLVEFAVVITVLLAMAFAYINLSRAISELIWVHAAAYEAAMIGITAPDSVRESSVLRMINGTGSSEFLGLINLHQLERGTPLKLEPFECTPSHSQGCSTLDYYSTDSTPATGDIPNSVVVKLFGELPGSWLGWKVPFAERVTGPILVLDSESAGDLAEFSDDPKGTKWGCCENSPTTGSSYPSSSCASVLNDPSCK